MTPLLVTLPIRTKSPNRSFIASMGARMAQAAETRAHKSAAHLAVSGHLRARGLQVADLEPVLVVLTRISAGRLDFGNLVASMKGVQDGVCLALGLDDGPRDEHRLRIDYRQRKGPRSAPAVEVFVGRDERRALLPGSMVGASRLLRGRELVRGELSGRRAGGLAQRAAMALSLSIGKTTDVDAQQAVVPVVAEGSIERDADGRPLRLYLGGRR